MGLFKSKEERRLERDIKIRQGIRRIEKAITEQNKFTDEFVKNARQAKQIGSNLEATVKLTLPEVGFGHTIFADVPALQEFFILSDLHLTRGPALAATVEVCTNPKCERCWRLLPDVGTHAAHPTLCGRCVEAVS